MGLLDDLMSGNIGVLDLEEARRALGKNRDPDEARAGVQENINTARSLWPKDDTIESRAAHVVFDVNQMLLDTASAGDEINHDVYEAFSKLIVTASDVMTAFHRFGQLRQGAVDAYISQNLGGSIKTGEEEAVEKHLERFVKTRDGHNIGIVRAVNPRTSEAAIVWNSGPLSGKVTVGPLTDVYITNDHGRGEPVTEGTELSVEKNQDEVGYSGEEGTPGN
jgi:hypothetical protein